MTGKLGILSVRKKDWGSALIVNQDGDVICRVPLKALVKSSLRHAAQFDEERNSIAELIVRAVNSLPELEEALERLLSKIDGAEYEPMTINPLLAVEIPLSDVLEAKAALNKAKGKG